MASDSYPQPPAEQDARGLSFEAVIAAASAGDSDARRPQEAWLATLIDALPDIVCFKDSDNRHLVANRFYLELFRLNAADFVNRTTEELAGLSPFYQSVFSRCGETDEWAWREKRAVTFEQSVLLPEGGEMIFDMRKMPLFNGDGSRKGLVMIGRNVTEHKKAAERIHHLAHHDSLTGLPNRVLFHERMQEALARARRSSGAMALLLLDLDKFKEVNDTLGHHVGDLLLRAVAKRLGYCVRETDTVARLGGDEFAVLLTHVNGADGAGTVAETIIRSIAEPFDLDDNEVVCGVSVGITMFPADGRSGQELLKNADLALYRSKNNGRGRYHFYVAEMDREVQNCKAIERDLRHALTTNQQLTLFYQPLVDLRHGRIIGAEALLRWFHPEKGVVAPGVFIPIAERSELIFRIGRWVLQNACLQIREWRKAGLPALPISVNLSPAQFRHPDLLETIRVIIEQTGVDPTQLQLEITETTAMTNFEYSVQVLRDMRQMGLTIAIDDFGTGYSSLNYLRHFPVDKLKIDRSFVIDSLQYPSNDAILRAIVDLGHGIGATVNVEGIETMEQLHIMRRLACDECQGNYFSPALPPDEYARLIGRTEPWAGKIEQMNAPSTA